MLLFVLALAAADPVDRPAVDGDGAGARDVGVVEPIVVRRLPRDPAPAWQFFVVPAGLSLTSSVLLAVPEALLFPFLSIMTLSIVVAGAPVVAGVGMSRLEGVGAGSYVGLVAGDALGVIGGAVAGVFVFDRSGLKNAFVGNCGRAAEECFPPRFYAFIGAGVIGSFLGRAVGSGAGAFTGHLIDEAFAGDVVTP